MLYPIIHTVPLESQLTYTNPPKPLKTAFQTAQATNLCQSHVAAVHGAPPLTLSLPEG